MLDKAFDIAKKIQQCAVDAKLAELQSYVADLTLELSETMTKTAALTKENRDLKDENSKLREKRESVPPKMKWGCYQWNGDERLYCIKCYEEHVRKSPTTREGFSTRQCCVCNNRVSTG